jgi:hypothetical protein
VASTPRDPHLLVVGCNDIRNHFSSFQITIVVHLFMTTFVYFMSNVIMHVLCLVKEHATSRCALILIF